MAITKRWFFAALVAAFMGFYAAPTVLATPVSIYLSSPGSTLTGENVLANVYVGAYTATINGVSTPVICDDYADESYVPESWTANSTSLASSSLSATKWQNLTEYEEAGWLVEQMYNNASNPSQVGDISFAIWGIFDPQALTDLQAYSTSNNTSDYSNALSWLSQAESSSNYTSVDLADFTIYTPVVPPAPTCYNGQNQPVQCAKSPPQEFMVYNAPEPSFFAILGADLVLFGVALVILRRRRVVEPVR